VIFSKVILVIYFSNFLNASNVCWQNEKNTLTQKTFSQEEWTLANESWQQLMPQEIGYFKLYKAWRIYRSESKTLNKLKKDKLKHCYLGCRISQEISYEASAYLAWYKEYKDLNDCDKTTFFEVLDAEATLKGAEFGEQTKVPEDCFNLCTEK
jgi:hypothetical protein